MTDTDQRRRPAGAPGPAPAPAPRLPMDPRFRQRRVAVRRDEGRRRLRVLLACVGVAGALAAAAGATRSPLLDVDRVELQGARHTTHRQVVEAGALGGRPAMTDVDESAVERRLEALPWIRDATVRRRWPSTVRVTLTERRPVAVVPADGAWAMVDAAGRVVAAGPDKPGGLPVLGNLPAPGPPGSSVAPAAAVPLRVAAALPPDLRARVADVAALGDGDVEMLLAAPGGVVRLGRPVDLPAKLASLRTLLSRADVAGAAVIDVRVPRAPVLTRR